MTSDRPRDEDAVIPRDANTTFPTEETATISLVEETAVVDVHRRVTGRTRVTTRTETTVEDVGHTLETRSVSVTRVPIGRDLDPGEPVPGIREEGDVTIMPILEEVVVVEKRLRLVEEIHILRTTETEDILVPVTLRRQIAEIEHDDLPDGDTSTQTQ